MKTPITIVRAARTFLAAASILSIATVARADYQGVVLADHPLAFYALDPATDPSGDSPDLSGNGNDGFANDLNPATGPSAYIPNAASFDGVSSFDDISLGNNPGLLIFNGPMTLEAWVQPASSTLFADIIAQGYENTSGYPEIALRVNGPYGGNYYGGSENTNFSISVSGGDETTDWTYVVVSMDGTNCSLYQNGALVARTADAYGSTIFSTPDDWVIGDGSGAGNGRLFDGNISEVAMYNYGLTAAQVSAHYNEGMYGSTNPPPPPAGPLLKWSANNNSGVWDNDSSTNWIVVTNGQPSVFNNGDQALFDDTVGAPTSVTVNGTVSPDGITVNASTNNYTISSGAFSGSGSLVKEGSSTLTLDTQGLTGPVKIGGGTLYAGNNSLDAASSITISNGATLDLAGGSFSLDNPVTVSGTGVGGEGAIINSYNDGPGEMLAITMAGNTKFGAADRWDMNSGSISGPYDLTVDWSAGAGYGQWNGVSIGANVLGVTVTNSSTLGITGMDSSCQNPATVFDISSGSQIVFYSGGFNGSLSLESGSQMVLYSGNVNLGGSTLHLYGGSTMYLYSSGIAMTGNNLIFEDGAVLQTYYNGGNNPIANQVTLNGTPHFVLGDHSMTFNGAIGGAGGFVVDYYNNEIILPKVNTYSGPTIIGSSGNSPEVVLTGNGSISDSSLIFFGGSDSTVTHMDVSGRSDQTLTLASGQTLAGIGAINGNLVVTSGATISPAGSNTTINITTGANATGTIAASGTVALNGTTVIKLNGSGVNDQVQSTGAALSYSGTLSLINVSGSPLANGNSFQIFSASGYSGSFGTITPTTPGAGLVWDTSHLNSTGFLNVMWLATGPVIGTTTVSGGNLVFSGTGGTSGNTYYVLTTTNLASANWVKIATNTFGTGGSFSVTNTINPGTPRQFYKIEPAP